MAFPLYSLRLFHASLMLPATASHSSQFLLQAPGSRLKQSHTPPPLHPSPRITSRTSGTPSQLWSHLGSLFTIRALDLLGQTSPLLCAKHGFHPPAGHYSLVPRPDVKPCPFPESTMVGTPTKHSQTTNLSLSLKGELLRVNNGRRHWLPQSESRAGPEAHNAVQLPPCCVQKRFPCALWTLYDFCFEHFSKAKAHVTASDVNG